MLLHCVVYFYLVSSYPAKSKNEDDSSIQHLVELKSSNKRTSVTSPSISPSKLPSKTPSSKPSTKIPSSNPSITFSPTGNPPTAEITNPFSRNLNYFAQPYVQKYLQSSIATATGVIASRLQNLLPISTPLYISSISYIYGTTTRSLSVALPIAAASPKKPLFTIGIYNLPNRDCSVSNCPFYFLWTFIICLFIFSFPGCSLGRRDLLHLQTGWDLRLHCWRRLCGRYCKVSVPIYRPHLQPPFPIRQSHRLRSYHRG